MNKSIILFRWLKAVILIYCSTGLLLYYLQEKFLFQGVELPATYHYILPFLYTEKNLVYDNQTNFNIIQFPSPDSISRGIILYFHGNKENVNHYAERAGAFLKRGYEVWMPDYPGYGKSTGSISEPLLYQEALQVYQLARVRYKPNQIILYGRSMGSGIAAQLATVRDCKRLILETPYTSLVDLVDQYCWMFPTKHMLHYTIPTKNYLQKVIAPVTIFHGTNDWVIHFSNSIQLKKVLKSGDRFIAIKDAGHNNLDIFPEFRNKLDSLLVQP